ncbi:MAG: hypothetical protein MUP81_06470 [Dehalococcoidia bacterium]|nr:hypothetical protein [Dehalococcoidia bacterium]
MANKWELKDLPPLKVGDCLAFEATGWQKVVHIIKAVSFHWALIGEALVDDTISHGDYAVCDSIDKGITTHLLSEYQGRGMRIYRPKLPPDYQRELAPLLIKRYCYYGDQRYDWFGVLAVATWLILRKLGWNVEWWVHDSNRFWCLEFNEIVWRDLGYPLVPEDEPPHPGNMEKSPMLELIWSTF